MVALPPVSSGKTITEKDVDAQLRRLDKELELRDDYVAERHQLIDSLKKIASGALPADTAQIMALLKIGDNYNAFNIDSALWFYNRGFNIAHATGDDSNALRFAFRQQRILPLLLFFSKSQRLADSIRSVNIPDALKAEQVDAERQMQFYTANFFTKYPVIYDSIMRMHNLDQELLLEILPENNNLYILNDAEHHFHLGDYTRAQLTLNELIKKVKETDPIYARASHLLAEIAKVNGDELSELYHLALSAISDTRCSTLEVTSLQELGKALYERGDIERAHNYMAVALKNAVDCNAALRIIQTSQNIPLIEKAHKEQLQQSRMKTYGVIAAMTILLIILIFTIRLLNNRNKQLAVMAQKLTAAGNTKDAYITQFLNLCSIYMDKLNQFNNIVNSKISAGKVDDLLKLTKSGKLIEEQSKEFYEVFDDAFLHLYPNFVADVNALLLPERKITLKETEKLNTDLRILALMRLGISDSSRIAEMLNYSLHTIYTYRNKFKARAINRDTFENDIRAIKSTPLT